jgi:hypothetical protein
VPERRFAEKLSNAPMPCRLGLAETIGMNEAALGAGLWGRNPAEGAERWIRAGDMPRAWTEGVEPSVDQSDIDELRPLDPRTGNRCMTSLLLGR